MPLETSMRQIGWKKQGIAGNTCGIELEIFSKREESDNGAVRTVIGSSRTGN
jgi:hypothetical protein